MHSACHPVRAGPVVANLLFGRAISPGHGLAHRVGRWGIRAPVTQSSTFPPERALLGQGAGRFRDTSGRWGTHEQHRARR
jgi:hypothetical protein